jgi:dihydrofolate reductase
VITLVVARADNGVIGRNGALPWHLPEDLRHFKKVTMGSAMIMGRKTFDSLPGLLPGRRHIVLTHDRSWKAEGVESATSPEGALAVAGAGPISIIGGAEIFALFEPHAHAVELTEVHCDAEGDVSMPAFDETQWCETSRSLHEAEGERPAFSFVRLERQAS